jgi:hypothetical protein
VNLPHHLDRRLKEPEFIARLGIRNTFLSARRTLSGFLPAVTAAALQFVTYSSARLVLLYDLILGLPHNHTHPFYG